MNLGGYFKLAVSRDFFKFIRVVLATTSRPEFGRTAASWEHLEYELLDTELWVLVLKHLFLT